MPEINLTEEQKTSTNTRANPNAIDNNGKTSLALAIEGDDIGAVNSLIKDGADVNALDESGKAPLIAALEKGTLYIAKALIAAGASPNATDTDGKTALMLASQLNKVSPATATLIEESPRAQHNISIASANCARHRLRFRKSIVLEDEIKNVCGEVAEDLISAGANVNTKDENGKTLLILALEQSHWYVAKALIAGKANVDAIDNNGKTPLIIALEDDAQHGLAKDLIAAGADVNAIDKNGTTPLVAALEWGKYKVAQNLIAAGAKFDKNDLAKTKDKTFLRVVIEERREFFRDCEERFEKIANFLHRNSKVTRDDRGYISKIDIIKDYGDDQEALLEDAMNLNKDNIKEFLCQKIQDDLNADENVIKINKRVQDRLEYFDNKRNGINQIKGLEKYIDLDRNPQLADLREEEVRALIFSGIEQESIREADRIIEHFRDSNKPPKLDRALIFSGNRAKIN
jgi:ankyrin repeat protein